MALYLTHAPRVNVREFGASFDDGACIYLDRSRSATLSLTSDPRADSALRPIGPHKEEDAMTLRSRFLVCTVAAAGDLLPAPLTGPFNSVFDPVIVRARP